MSEREETHVSHEEEENEVTFRPSVEVTDSVENSTAPTMSPQMVTQSDLQEVIDGWKVKFHQLSSRGIAERAKEPRSAGFRRCKKASRASSRDPAHIAAARPFDSPCTPVVSTPITPSGISSRHRPNFHLASPVDQPTRNTDKEFDQRPTHENDHDNSGDDQRSPIRTINSGMNNSASRPSSSPKVPIFDGTVSAQFRPWIIQFEAIARHQCWTLGERVVRLVASLTGPAANLLIGMTMGQLDDNAFLVAHLSRRYDPPEREEAHRAQSYARTQDAVMSLQMNLQKILRTWPSAPILTRIRIC